MPVCRMARALQRATAHDQNASDSSGAAIRHTGNFVSSGRLWVVHHGRCHPRLPHCLLLHRDGRSPHWLLMLLPLLLLLLRALVLHLHLRRLVLVVVLVQVLVLVVAAAAAAVVVVVVVLLLLLLLLFPRLGRGRVSAEVARSLQALWSGCRSGLRWRRNKSVDAVPPKYQK